MTTPGELPFVSVVVPVWNGADHISDCLRAIEQQSYPADRYELLVVDNGSTDETAEMVKAHPRAQLLVETSPGSYRARNLALKRAAGDYVLFTDADCVADRGWIAAAVAAARAHPEAGVLGGQITLFDTQECSSRACVAYELLFSFNQELSLASGYSVTANWMSPTALLRELGGFDANLRSGGDVQMSSRISEHGRALVYVRGMKVAHPIRGTFSELRAKLLRTLGGRWSEREPGFARIIIAQLGLARASYRRIMRALRASSFSGSDRVRIALLVARLYPHGVVEIMRLTAGGKPRRA